MNSSYLIYDLINKQKQSGVAVVYVGEDLDPTYVRATTMALAAIVFSQIGEVMNCRTELASVFSVGLFSNKQVNKGILFEVALIVFITLFPPFQDVFHTCPLNAWDYLYLVLLPPAVRRQGHYDRNGVRMDTQSER